MRLLPSVLLLGSLALNAGLAYRLLAPAGPPAAATPARAPVATTPDPITTDTWQRLSTADPKTVHERLLAAGFPADVARAIVAAQLQRDLDARREALLAGQGNVAFWKDPAQNAALQAELRRLQREGRQRVREVLGTDEPTGLAAALSGQVSFLPAAKAEKLRELLLESIDRSFDAAGDQVKQRAIEEERRAAIRQLLTPEELAEYDLRTSNTSNRLRNELTAFRPTEEEFRAIHSLRHPFDEKYDRSASGVISITSELGRQRIEEERQLAAQIKAALGPARGADYERSMDQNYRTTSQLVGRLELPADTTDRLYAMQKEFEAKRSELFRGSPSAEDRMARANGLQQEALARVATVLTDPVHVEAYRQYGGNWISQLVPRVMAPARAAPAPPPPTK